MSKWIWLEENKYKKYQRSSHTCFPQNKHEYKFCVAEFFFSRDFKEDIDKIDVKISADVHYRFWVNGKFSGTGPASSGGDFAGDRAMPNHYIDKYELFPKGTKLEILVQAQNMPTVMTHWSRGHGGLYLEIIVHYKSGKTETITTDENWKARINYFYKELQIYDEYLNEDEWTNAVITEDIWNAEDSYIPSLSESIIAPLNQKSYSIQPGESKRIEVSFDKIYSGFINLDISGACEAQIEYFERPEDVNGFEKVSIKDKTNYRSLRMHSIGGYFINAKNLSNKVLTISPSVIFCCYPVLAEGHFVSSDSRLNKIYDVCKWTLQICRQSLHLDSPLHQEPLACTGDYFIQTMMTAFTFGDMRLSEFDIIRTGNWLVENKGVMFHTSYSLIWVQMLAFTYKFTGNKKLVSDMKDAIHILLDRFNSYVGANGLIENAPNYMFVDWIVLEGYNMHHPPKALGQSVLNAFYYKALCDAAYLLNEIESNEQLELYLHRAKTVRDSMNKYLFVEEKMLYIDGLTTPTEENQWLPANTNIIHYSYYPNTLAVLYGICDDDDAPKIMEKIINDSTIKEVQPYFMHFVLEAIEKAGLFSKYGVDFILKWDKIVKECDKGLKEGWFAPEIDYRFDFSHAWGGTPAYQLPSKFLGFEMIEPGFGKIKLTPCLFGLEYVDISMPTPYGFIKCKMKKGEEPIIEIPREIPCCETNV